MLDTDATMLSEIERVTGLKEIERVTALTGSGGGQKDNKQTSKISDSDKCYN